MYTDAALVDTFSEWARHARWELGDDTAATAYGVAGHHLYVYGHAEAAARLTRDAELAESAARANRNLDPSSHTRRAALYRQCAELITDDAGLAAAAMEHTRREQ